MENAHNPPRWLDVIGIVFSSACAIQCAAMPILLGILPILSDTLIAKESFEWLMIVFVAVIATTSLTLGYRMHRNPLPFCLLILGILTLIGTRLFVEEETVLFLILLALGGFTIAYAHWRNHLYTCRCRECADFPNV